MLTAVLYPYHLDRGSEPRVRGPIGLKTCRALVSRAQRLAHAVLEVLWSEQPRVQSGGEVDDDPLDEMWGW